MTLLATSGSSAGHTETDEMEKNTNSGIRIGEGKIGENGVSQQRCHGQVMTKNRTFKVENTKRMT